MSGQKWSNRTAIPYRHSLPQYQLQQRGIVAYARSVSNKAEQHSGVVLPAVVPRARLGQPLHRSR
eukprot:1468725-Rhodomonas_salina.1